MEYIFVTLCCGDIMEDLKIPAFISGVDLIEIFSGLYGIAGKMLHAEPKGIILDKSKTLADQGIGHGSKLTLG